MQSTTADDLPTLGALGVVAFAIADVSHEALGHGLATLAVGGRVDLLTTCFLNSSGNYSKWIPASGGLANLAVGLCSVKVLRSSAGWSGHCRYFLVLVAAFNLFFAFGYPAYSGIARFGDWAAVISGCEPHWLWRVLLILVSVIGYYGSMRLLAKPLAPFAVTVGGGLTEKAVDKARLRRLTGIPYIAAMILASLAGALNPNGWQTMLTAGLPAAAAAFGLTQMDHFVDSDPDSSRLRAIEPLQRNLVWILAATAVLIFFVGVLGPGIRFTRR
jgi:hypothetical protein